MLLRSFSRDLDALSDSWTRDDAAESALVQLRGMEDGELSEALRRTRVLEGLGGARVCMQVLLLTRVAQEDALASRAGVGHLRRTAVAAMRYLPKGGTVGNVCADCVAFQGLALLRLDAVSHVRALVQSLVRGMGGVGREGCALGLGRLWHVAGDGLWDVIPEDAFESVMGLLAMTQLSVKGPGKGERRMVLGRGAAFSALANVAKQSDPSNLWEGERGEVGRGVVESCASEIAETAKLLKSGKKEGVEEWDTVRGACEALAAWLLNVAEIGKAGDSRVWGVWEDSSLLLTLLQPTSLSLHPLAQLRSVPASTREAAAEAITVTEGIIALLKEKAGESGEEGGGEGGGVKKREKKEERVRRGWGLGERKGRKVHHKSPPPSPTIHTTSTSSSSPPHPRSSRSVSPERVKHRKEERRRREEVGESEEKEEGRRKGVVEEKKEKEEGGLEGRVREVEMEGVMGVESGEEVVSTPTTPNFLTVPPFHSSRDMIDDVALASWAVLGCVEGGGGGGGGEDGVGRSIPFPLLFLCSNADPNVMVVECSGARERKSLDVDGRDSLLCSIGVSFLRACDVLLEQEDVGMIIEWLGKALRAIEKSTLSIPPPHETLPEKVLRKAQEEAAAASLPSAPVCATLLKGLEAAHHANPPHALHASATLQRIQQRRRRVMLWEE